MEKFSNQSEPTNGLREGFVEKKAVFELHNLGLDLDNLRNKLTLDLGAGSAAIAEAGEKRGLKVISLDRNPEMWEKRKMHIPDVPYVKSSAEVLPFADKTFDLVISHAGPLSITASKELIAKTLEEVKRVLKEGGELRFGPGNLNSNIFTDEELFSPEERKSLTREQRIKRIGQKSLEFLKSIDPNITQNTINEQSDDLLANHFYILKKEHKEALKGEKDK